MMTEEAFEAAQASEQSRAMALVAELGGALRRAGWDFVCIRVSTVLANGEDRSAPGATFMAASQAVVPALPREADALRGVAATCDRAFEKAGCGEATEAYSEDKTREFLK